MDTCTTEISQQLELLELLELLDLLELLEIRKKHPLVTDSLSDNFKSRVASASKNVIIDCLIAAHQKRRAHKESFGGLMSNILCSRCEPGRR